MKIVIATDSFKGCLTSHQAATAIEKGILRAMDKSNLPIEIFKMPIADGGEGTVETVIYNVGGDIVATKVIDPLGRDIDSFFGVLPDNTAIIEMAAASGLDLVEPNNRDPLRTTSFGTGQLIKAAMDFGCKNIILGIGGSATNDGGVGMCQALGISFKDIEEKEINFGGGQLGKIRRISVDDIDKRISDTNFTIASDVANVLSGPNGASAMYGPQKGATSDMIKTLDDNLRHLSKLLRRYAGKDISTTPGSGAAGGLGATAMTFLNPTFRLGIEMMMQLIKFEENIKDASLIVTGEGSTDIQTLYGKVPFGVAKVAKKYKKPVICISGKLGDGFEELYNAGIVAMFSIIDKPMSLEEALEKAEVLLEKATLNIFNMHYTCHQRLRGSPLQSYF